MIAAIRTANIASEDPIPGIHEGTAEVLTLKVGSPKGVTVVVWCDRSSGSASHSSAHPYGAFSEEYFRLPDETHVAFRCKIYDGTIAQVTIDGHKYDSSKGSLFLISTQSKEIQIKQLDADLRDFPKESVGIKDYALDNPDICAFFTDAKNNNSVEHEQ